MIALLFAGSLNFREMNNSLSVGAAATIPSLPSFEIGQPGQKLVALAYIGLFYLFALIVVLLLWYQLWVKNLGGKNTLCINRHS